MNLLLESAALLFTFLVASGSFLNSVSANKFKASCSSFYPSAGGIFKADTFQFLKKIPSIYSCGRIYLAVEDHAEMYKVCVKRLHLPEYYAENVKNMKASDFSSTDAMEKVMKGLSVQACDSINKYFADHANDESQSTAKPENYKVDEDFEFISPELKTITEKDEKYNYYEPNYKGKAANGFKSLKGITIAFAIFFIVTGGAVAAFYGVKQALPDVRKGDESYEPPIEEILENFERGKGADKSDLPPSYEEINENVKYAPSAKDSKV